MSRLKDQRQTDSECRGKLHWVAQDSSDVREQVRILMQRKNTSTVSMRPSRRRHTLTESPDSSTLQWWWLVPQVGYRGPPGTFPCAEFPQDYERIYKGHFPVTLYFLVTMNTYIEEPFRYKESQNLTWERVFDKVEEYVSVLVTSYL